MLARRQKGWKLCRDSFAAADLNLPVGRLLMSVLTSKVQPRGRCETMLLGVNRNCFLSGLRDAQRSSRVVCGAYPGGERSP